MKLHLLNPSAFRRLLSLVKISAVGGFCLILWLGCESAPIEFTKADRRMIDSIFQDKKPALDQKVDSVCAAWVQQHYKTYKDSLMDRRWAEIEQILRADE